ncbi:MAG: copper-binding transcription factor [Bathelium mastoideum]|nr:MAG: copper-binding transcription factor [Bathelium mastoideum]
MSQLMFCQESALSQNVPNNYEHLPTAEFRQDASKKASQFKKPSLPFSPVKRRPDNDFVSIKPPPSDDGLHDGNPRRIPIESESSALTCRECGKAFRRPCDLTKHEKTHSRPWKCPEIECKYFEYGLPTEKELNRHVNDKHSATPKLFKCLFSPCEYSSKRESNCKQHMEKAHEWQYVRSKTNGQRKGKPKDPPHDPRSESRASSRSRTPLTPLFQHEYPNIILTTTSETPDPGLTTTTTTSASSISFSATAAASWQLETSSVDLLYDSKWPSYPQNFELDTPLFKESQKSEDRDFVLFDASHDKLESHQLGSGETRIERCGLSTQTEERDDSFGVSRKSDSSLFAEIRHTTASTHGEFKPRLRTKTGCLNCRRRQIKCGGEPHGCSNCSNSNWKCEGYNSGIMFKNGNLEMRSRHDKETSPWISSWMVDTYTPWSRGAYERSASAETSNDRQSNLMREASPVVQDTFSSIDSAYASAASTVEPHFDGPDFCAEGLSQGIGTPKRRKLDKALKLIPRWSQLVPDVSRDFFESTSDNQAWFITQTPELTPGDSISQNHRSAEKGRRQRINSALQQIESLLPAAQPLESCGDTHTDELPDGGYDVSKNRSKAATMEKAIEYIKTLQQVVNSREKAMLKLGLAAEDAVSLDFSPSSERELSTETEASGSSDESEFGMDVDWTGHVLEPLRGPAVARLLELLFARLGAGIRKCHANGRGRTGNPSSSGPSQESNKGSSKQGKLSQKRKADELEGDGEDDEESNNGSRPSPTNGNREPDKFLACHFYKFNPQKHRDCARYKLRDISRVKQHLRRCHGVPIYCPSCYQTFNKEDVRDQHARSRTCQNRSPVKFEYVTEEQRKLLERRVSKNKSTFDNWFAIFETLFPGTAHPKTPYVDAILSEQLRELLDFTLAEGPQVIDELIQSQIPARLRPAQADVTAFARVLFQDAITVLLERSESNRSGRLSNEPSFTSPSQSEASPELARMPLPSQNIPNAGGYPQNVPHQQGQQLFGEALPNQYGHIPTVHANNPGFDIANPGLAVNNPGLAPSNPAFAMNNPGAAPGCPAPVLTQYAGPSAPRMAPNLSNGSWQPQTPDSGYRSGSAGNAVAGRSGGAVPTTSPFMGHDGSFDTVPGSEEWVDSLLLWPASRE